MRYAVYFCPAEGSGLHAFGRDWLTTDAIPGIAPERLRELLINVRRYGWHATLTAPFALAANASYDDLHRKLIPIAQHVEPFKLPLTLDTLGGFLALRPSGDQTAISALAERCVLELNPLRAPLTDSAWQRRANGLDEVELALFRDYGYPYVIQRYRFHMTLSARASHTEEQALRAWLIHHGADQSPAHIDALTICREQAPNQPYEPIARIPLGNQT
jgi:Protein of unknown function (DUF1045)